MADKKTETKGAAHEMTERMKAAGEKMRASGEKVAERGSELGMKLLQQVKADTTEFAKVEAEPKLEGRQMMMVLAPK